MTSAGSNRPNASISVLTFSGGNDSAADRQENKFFDAWVKDAKLNTAAGRDIVWRNRGTHGAKYLAEIILDRNTLEAEKPRYLRALDFIPKSKEKDEALARIALGAF